MSRFTSVSRLIHSSREAAYRAFLDPELLVRWLPPAGMTGTVGNFEPRVGGAFEITLRYTGAENSQRGKSTEDSDSIVGSFAELVPGERVAWVVVFQSADQEFAGEMRVRATFTEADAGVTVELRCDGIPPGIRLEDNEVGSRLSLANLAALLEN